MTSPGWSKGHTLRAGRRVVGLFGKHSHEWDPTGMRIEA